jgi:SAM-dependent methyltransferase
MIRIRLAREVANRLAAFLAVDRSAARTDHWRHYGSLNSIRIEGDCALVDGGAGFDSEYELNFRRRSIREATMHLVRAALGRSDVHRIRAAYQQLWSETAPATRSPHEVVAQHYMKLLGQAHVGAYLEIGAGTGYLAALAHQAWNASVTIIDLQEILPFGFLYLHTRFPRATFALPNERGPATFTFLTDGGALRDDSIDLAVNTASFGEMNTKTIEQYFLLIRRVLRPGGRLFTVNREEKVMDGLPIRFADYPWLPGDADYFFELSRLHAAIQPQNRMLARLCRMAKLDS